MLPKLGGLFVMMIGPMRMHLWHANSWASLHMVCSLVHTKCSFSFHYSEPHISAGAIPISAGPMFLESSRVVFLMMPECLGNESVLTDCPQSNSLTCGSQEGVGVLCQGKDRM